jgi:hypothetical protein
LRKSEQKRGANSILILFILGTLIFFFFLAGTQTQGQRSENDVTTTELHLSPSTPMLSGEWKVKKEEDSLKKKYLSLKRKTKQQTLML